MGNEAQLRPARRAGAPRHTPAVRAAQRRADQNLNLHGLVWEMTADALADGDYPLYYWCQCGRALLRTRQQTLETALRVADGREVAA